MNEPAVRNYRVLDQKGDVVSEVSARTIEQATYAATVLGYDVIDYDGDTVIVNGDQGQAVLMVRVWSDGRSDVGSPSGGISPTEAVRYLRAIADALEGTTDRGRFN